MLQTGGEESKADHGLRRPEGSLTKEPTGAIIGMEGDTVMIAWLEKGEDIYEIVPPVTTLGRDETNNITLPIDLVSRVHAIVYENDGSYFIRDLGSANGTSVNGERIGRDTALRNGDAVTVGFELTFKTGETLPKSRERERRPDEVYGRMTHVIRRSELPPD
jgi:pSer/pThr/pTyr-binding forkhead associated (FHA) protein